MKSKRICLSCTLALFFLYSRAQSWKQYADSAKYYQEQRENKNAVNYYLKASSTLPADSLYSATRFQYFSNVGQLVFATGFYDSSTKYFLTALEILEKRQQKESLLYTGTNDLLGQAYFFSGSYNDAERTWSLSLQMHEGLKGTESAEYARSCNLLGVLHYTIGQFQKAETYHLHAKQVREKLNGRENAAYAQSANNLSNVYRDLGQFDKAEPLALEAKEIRFRVLKQPHDQYAISCINLANLYTDLGQYDEAEALYLEGKKVRGEALDTTHPQYAAVCNKLADLYVIVGKHKEAEELYIEAKSIRDEKLDTFHSDNAQTRNNLANLYFTTGKYVAAEKLYLEAKQIWDSVLKNDDPAHAFNRTSLGKLYITQGNYKEAEIYLNEAKRLWELSSGKNHPNYTWTSNELAKLYWAENNITQADETYSETFSVQQTQLNRVFQFTNETEKLQYLQNVKGSANEYYSFYFRKFPANDGAKAYTRSLLDRNLILTSSSQLRTSIFESTDTFLVKQYDRWVSFRQQIANYYSRSDLQSNSNINIKELENQADQLEKDLSRKSSIFKATQQKDLSWKAISNKLNSDEAAIEFVEFNLFDGQKLTDSTIYAAILIRKEFSSPHMVYLFEKRQLDSILVNTSEDNVASLYRGGVASAQSSISYSDKIFHLIWKPLEAHLSGIRKIYFAPAGDLFKISFAAIRINDTKLLSDKYQLLQITTTASILEGKNSLLTSKDELVMYGGILYDADPTALAKTVSIQNKVYKKTRSTRAGNSDTRFNYLEGTLTEVKGLEKQALLVGIKTKSFTGLSGTEESFKSLTGQNSPAILHIATHGFFYSDPGQDSLSNSKNVFSASKNPLIRSGLLFAGSNNTFLGKMPKELEDGILTAYEVSNMYLPKTKLVVLSACETARGDIQGSEGVYGLQRSFRMAGVQNLVMSLWEVPDIETAEFMQELYKNIFKKVPVSDAFYNAQTTMKNKYRKEPEKWAAWVLVR